MEFTTLTEQEFTKFAKNHPQASFMQTIELAHLKEELGGIPHIVGVKEKNKVTMPTLSDDQINELQEKILTAFNNQSIIKIKYFRNGRYYINEGIITNIDV